MDALFAKTTFRFEIEDTITRWSLDKIIAEDFDTNNGWPCVAAGVFECHHVDPTKDDDILEAIIKVYVQMPHSEDNGEINVTPYDETPQWVRSEIKALKLISTLPIEDCPGPRFLSSRHPKQSDEMWLPGGCCCAILMTKVLGETLGPTKYRTWPQAKRAEIYDAFAKSFNKLLELGIYHPDPALHNLIWDERTKKCSIIDYEGASFLPEGDDKIRNSDYRLWGLWY